MPDFLANYSQLTTRVDALCANVESACGEQITCTEGCSSCCTSITVFPVEAAALRAAFQALPEEEQRTIRQFVIDNAAGESCPLLSGDRCLLYSARPLICRTHGLPIIYTEENKRKSDCCPLNMTGTRTVNGSSVIDLDKLNTLLVAVNSHYLAQYADSKSAERIAIADAITRTLFTSDL